VGASALARAAASGAMHTSRTRFHRSGHGARAGTTSHALVALLRAGARTYIKKAAPWAALVMNSTNRYFFVAAAFFLP
jgi:hypothetical protein